MNRIITYLTFNGNCLEAMKFYRYCLGGELSFQTLGESPKTEMLPQHMQGYIVQAFLKNDNLLLMGTDMVEEEGLIQGNSSSILMDCHSPKEMKKFYMKLATGSKHTYPIKRTFFGGYFGRLTDKFGYHWLFHYNPEINNIKKQKNGSDKIQNGG